MATKPKVKTAAYRLPPESLKKLDEIGEVVGLVRTKIIALILKGITSGALK